MKSLFLLLKFLASVNVCIAFNSSVGQLHSVPHSLLKGRALSEESREREGDQAGDGKYDTAKEEKILSLGRIFGHAPAKGNTESNQKLLPNQKLPESANTEQTRKATKLAAKVLDGAYRHTSTLVKKLAVLQKNKDTELFANQILMSLLQNPKTERVVSNAWVKSGKTPTEVSTFLVQNGPSQSWLAFIESDRYTLWLIYVEKYWKSIRTKEMEASKKAVGELLWKGRTEEEQMMASNYARLSKVAVGKVVSDLVFSPANINPAKSIAKR